jgi:hypothetical protein
MSAPSPSHETDPRVDDYIDRLPGWEQAICRELRDLIHGADPDIRETVKRTIQPYFVLQGNVCALLATKDHVNLFLYDGGIVPDPEGIITAGHENKTARMISLYSGDTINAPALTAMLQQIIANNRAGGWRSSSATAAAEPSTADRSLGDAAGCARQCPRNGDRSRPPGRLRSPATLASSHQGSAPCNNGLRHPADLPTVEEIIAVLESRRR